MARRFPRTQPAWGLRAYLVLMGCAADRQTVTYEDLARRINRGGPNLLARPLDLITRWCQRHSVPAIASLVVEQATGLPAPGFAAVTRDEQFRTNKNGFGILIGSEFCRLQSKNWPKAEGPLRTSKGPNGPVRITSRHEAASIKERLGAMTDIFPVLAPEDMCKNAAANKRRCDDLCRSSPNHY